jgi:hypothetical protein
VKEATHLALAGPNRALASDLADSNTEVSWRWTTVVAFYAAHHYVHALLDHLSHQLPADQHQRAARAARLISFVHPTQHGRYAGGTRGSLDLLSRRFTDLTPLNSLFALLLDRSHIARYGRWDNDRLSLFNRADAERSIHQLEELVGIDHLSPSPLN